MHSPLSPSLPQLTRRSALARALLLAPLAATTAGAWAAGAYPEERPIRMVVPWAPGGATDAIARLIAVPLGQALGQSVIVDNKPGAGGNIGTAQFVREKPDGYALIMATSSTHAVNPHLYARLPFDAAKDFTPVAFVASVPNVLVVRAASPYKTLADLLAAARAQPGKLSYGSAGNGSSQHLAGSMFARAAGLQLSHIPYKGSGPAASDLMAGHLDMMLDTGSLPHIQGGMLRALAVASPTRLPALPLVPTFAEAGLPGVQASAWYGVMAPAGLPQDIALRLNHEINRIVQQPAVARQLQELGAEARPGNPAQFQAFAANEARRYQAIVKESGASVD